MNGHCRHCHRYCQGSAEEQGMVWVIAAQRHHARLHLAEWDDGHCPACAEAERIADEITATIPDEYPGIADLGTMQLLTDVYAECARIARGEA